MIVFLFLIPLLVQCGEVRNQNRILPFNPNDMRFARQLPDPTVVNQPEIPPTEATDAVHPLVTQSETPISYGPTDTVQSVTTSAPGAQRGQTCGGIAGIQCAPGLVCQGQGNFPDAAGTCEYVYGQRRPYVPAVVLPSGETIPPTRAYHHSYTTPTPTTTAPQIYPEFYPSTTTPPPNTTTAAPTTTALPTETATRKLVPVRIVPANEFQPLPPEEEPTSNPTTVATHTFDANYRRPEYYRPTEINITNGTVNGTNATATIGYQDAVLYEPTPIPTPTPTATPDADTGEVPVKFVDYHGNLLDKPHRVYRSSFRENFPEEQEDVPPPAVLPNLLQSAEYAQNSILDNGYVYPPPVESNFNAPPRNEESESSYVPWQPLAMVEKAESEMESESSRDQEEMEETERLENLEKQIRRTDALVESVVDALEALRNRLPQLVSEGKPNHAKYKIERDLMKARLEKGLEGLKNEDLDVSSFIEVGSQIRRRNADSDDNIAFLELEEEPSSNDIDSLLKNEPAAASKDALANEDERIERLLAETEDDEHPRKNDLNLEEDFAEVSSKIESVAEKKRKHDVKHQSPDTQELKDTINSASKLTAQIESYIKAQIDKINAPAKSSHKKASRKNYSFLDTSSSVTEQSDAEPEINSESLPSIESLRKRLSDDEPQF